jgi:hypothetical protein
MEEKTYQISEEIRRLFDDARANYDFRDSCINLLFRTKRAIEYARASVKANDEAWRLVFALYPNLRGRPLEYRWETRDVVDRSKT